MANVVTIEAESRLRAGKGAARATRRAGKVPAVIYGGRQEPDLISLDPRAVLRELHRPGWQSRLFEVQSGGQPIRALIRGVQFHPVTDAPEHVDFQRLTPGEAIRVTVPVHFENDGISPGLKRGGVLNVVRHAVEVMCDPDQIPEQFTADLGPLDFNDNVRWHDLRGTENARPVIARDFVVATVVPPTKIEVAAAEATATGGAAPAKAPAKGGSKAPARKG
jgi:large subunit ribosomal protein L25